MNFSNVRTISGFKIIIIGFHVTSEKVKLKILSFYLYQVKVILNKYLLACLQLGEPLCFENRTRFFHYGIVSL